MTDVVLGVDIGTASSKAVLADADGTVLRTAAREHGTAMPRPGWAEHDAEGVWWTDMCGLCHDLLSSPTKLQPMAICVSGIGPCVLPASASNQPLRPAILYGIDTRAVLEISEIDAILGREAILARGGSALSTQAVGPKLLWLRNHEPETWRSTRRLFMASSYLVARLTGEYVLDHHSASQCDPLYDIVAGEWAEDWVEAIAPGLELPRLAWPSEIVGSVHEAGALATGVASGTPVVAGTIDAWAESFSAGVRQPGDLMLMYGSTMFLVQAAAELHPQSSIWSTNGVLSGSYSAAAGMATSGSLIAWLRDLVGEESYESLIDDAESVPAGSDGLLMLPYLAGERSPLFDADARGVLAGFTLRHTRGHVFRSAYEATAYGVRDNLEVLADAVAAPTRIVAVGGGTRSALWMRIVSAVTGYPQELPSETTGAAYGDALLAAIGSGLVPPGRDWTRIVDRVEPDAEMHAVYSELFGLYRRLYADTADVAHSLARMQRQAVGESSQQGTT